MKNTKLTAAIRLTEGDTTLYAMAKDIVDKHYDGVKNA